MLRSPWRWPDWRAFRCPVSLVLTRRVHVRSTDKGQLEFRPGERTGVK